MDADRPRAGMFVKLALFGATAAFGAALVYFAVKDFARSQASLAWRTVDAIVLDVDKRGAACRYAYTVEGVNYVGWRTRFVTTSLGAPPFRTAAPGATIKVAVDPKDPGVAVAAPGGGAALFAVLMVGGGVFVFVGLAGMLQALDFGARRRAEQKAA